jgi:hypothetical protein
VFTGGAAGGTLELLEELTLSPSEFGARLSTGRSLELGYESG